MTRITKRNEDVLRAFIGMKEAGIYELREHFGIDIKNYLYALHKCGYIKVSRTVRRQIACQKPEHKPCMRDMHMYAITDKGRLLLQNLDFPPARQMQALKVPAKRPQPKPQPQPMKSPPPPKSVQKDSVPMRAVPDKHVSVNVMTAEIDGREVKITYGAGFEYEVYRPAPDRSRNYTPRPIRGILA